MLEQGPATDFNGEILNLQHVDLACQRIDSLPTAMTLASLSLTSLTPPCLFRALTGWECPLCGMTRGIDALLHFDLVGSVGFHPFAPAVAVVAVWLIGRTVWARVTRPGRRPAHRVPTWLAVVMPSVLILFTVVRNLPGMTALRP